MSDAAPTPVRINLFVCVFVCHSSQVEGLIRFDDRVESLLLWDGQIQNVCQKVNELVETISAAGIPTSSTA